MNEKKAYLANNNIVMRDAFKPSTIVRHFLAIISALILGLFVDQFFQMISKNRWHYLWLVLYQIVAIVLLVAAIQVLTIKYFKWDIVSNIYFLTIFLGSQSNLFNNIRRIKVL